MVSEQQLVGMAPAEVMRLIFEPGFSTRAHVSGTSGRGVGLDIVLNEVRGLGGTVDVQSTFGQGTRFMLMLPANLGTCPILLVRCGEHQLGLPVVAVDRIVPARRESIRATSAALKLEYHGE